MKPLPLLRVLLVAVAALGLPAAAVACLWDYDTLKQERARFPSTLELITGKFLRHSPEFYQWRIKDRLEKLKTDPGNLELHDDLAVAYQKTGQTDKAIDVMFDKEKIKPGVYETYSNLGTFYILKGEFAKGLPYIDKALAINPDAHFGREKYQKWLIEHALAQQDVQLQSEKVSEYQQKRLANFQTFLEQKVRGPDGGMNLEQVQAAVKGILGMMRFADHDHPLLLVALGDLLGSDHGQNARVDAKRLSARCYLLASYRVKEDDARKRLRGLADEVLKMQMLNGAEEGAKKLSVIEAEFKQEMADADEWYAALKAKEVAWIANGANVEEEFDRLYQEEPASASTSPEPLLTHDQQIVASIVGAIAGLIVAVIVVVWGLIRLSRLIDRKPNGPRG